MINVKVDADIPVDALTERVKAADTWLAHEVAANASQFVPFRQGTLRGSYLVGEDSQGMYVSWNTPYAHYLYEGEVYINPRYGRAGWQDEYGDWHGYKGAKVPSGRRIQYHTGGTGDHWVDRAEAAYAQHWTDGYAKIIGGKA